uniref:Uncharacterized protein n=1 Tax=Oryza nivara TaxID=4536 RepID=A0A0E0FUL2_ORYNI
MDHLVFHLLVVAKARVSDSERTVTAEFGIIVHPGGYGDQEVDSHSESDSERTEGASFVKIANSFMNSRHFSYVDSELLPGKRQKNVVFQPELWSESCLELVNGKMQTLGCFCGPQEKHKYYRHKDYDHKFRTKPTVQFFPDNWKERVHVVLIYYMMLGCTRYLWASEVYNKERSFKAMEMASVIGLFAIDDKRLILCV